MRVPMNSIRDARISPETLQRLRTAYRATAAALDFAALSRFEQWERLRARAAQPSIVHTELEALDALDSMLKSQLLDWLEQSVANDPPQRFKSA